MKLPESAGAQQSSAREISWQPSLGGEGKAWPGPQPHSHTAGHSWGKRASTVTVPQLHIGRACRHFALFLRDDEGQELFTLYRSTGKKTKARDKQLTCPRSQNSQGYEEKPRSAEVCGISPNPQNQFCREATEGIGGDGCSTEAGELLDLLDNTVTAGMVFMFSSFPGRLQGTLSRAGGKFESLLVPPRQPKLWRWMYLLSLISVAFPEEIIVENTGLEEDKRWR